MTTFVKETTGLVTTVHNGETFSEYPERYNVSIGQFNDIGFICNTDVERKTFGIVPMAESSFNGTTPTTRTELENFINLFFYNQKSSSGSGGTSLVPNNYVATFASSAIPPNSFDAPLCNIVFDRKIDMSKQCVKLVIYLQLSPVSNSSVTYTIRAKFYDNETWQTMNVVSTAIGTVLHMKIDIDFSAVKWIYHYTTRGATGLSVGNNITTVSSGTNFLSKTLELTVNTDATTTFNPQSSMLFLHYDHYL